jgi:hypothetical protein
MKKQKKIWISLLLSIILIVVLSGCSGLPKTAKINITISPNPVPYNSVSENWIFDVILSESNGVGVTLINLRIDSYDQAEELVNTQILYEEDIIDWFESNYIPAFSTLSDWIWHTGAEIKYDILTAAGVDDNGNPIEATGRIDYLPQ